METIYLNQLLHRIKINNLIDFTDKIHDWRRSGEGPILNSRLAKGAKMDQGDLVFLTETAYGSLLRQSLILVYEYSRDNEQSLPQSEKNNFKKLKTKICSDQSLQTVDIERLLKLMRDSIAHNSDSEKYPTTRIALHENFFINKKIKNKQQIKLEITPHDVYELIFMCGKYVQNPKFSKSKIGVDKDVLVELLEKGKLNIGDIPKVVEYYDEKGEVVKLDKYQIKCLFNTFQNYKKFLLSPKRDECLRLLLGKFPFKDNYTGNLQCVQRAVNFTDSIKFNYEYSDYKVKDDKSVKALERLMSLREIDSTLYINALFYIFSVSTPQNLQKYFKKFNYSEEDVVHLRNALMHGRYYYNENNAFELYDGENNDELSHFLTLKCKDLKAIVKEVTNSRIKEIEKESEKLSEENVKQ